ncbi:mTOR complex subunit lst8 [Acrasis kona]|uniref:Target of rapamycin complex subunit LST8 n=1 Tax=Acrasis kona TaxID=1008807 RepID=A0AAW2Z2P0_9EUKA
MPGVILCTASYDRTIRFWEATTGQCHHSVQYTDPQVNTLAITHNKEFLAAAGNNHVRLYHLNSVFSNSQQSPVIGSFDGHTGNVLSIGFNDTDSWLYTGSEDSTVRVWDIRTFSAKRNYKCSGAVNTVSLHPGQNDLVSGDETGAVRIWDLIADKCVFKVHPNGRVGIRSLSVSADGNRCAVANNEGDVFVYDVTRNESLSMKLLYKFKAHSRYILKCLISPDVKQICTASADQTVKLWDMSNLSEKNQQVLLTDTLEGHKRWVWDCAYSSDSAYLVTASSDMTARLWDLNKGEVIKEYRGHQKAVVCIALNDQPKK